MASEDSNRSVADYFVVAGLPQKNPQLLDECSLEVNLKNGAYQDPITDIAVRVQQSPLNKPAQGLKCLCNIIFVILTCFHLTNFLEEKNLARCFLKSNKVVHENLPLWTNFFSSATKTPSLVQV